MRISKDERSPWGQKIRFEDDEFESMMDELRHKAGKDAFCVGSGVDVDRVLMKAFQLEADYVPLPRGVLGRTIFGDSGASHIEVSRALSDEAEVDQLARRRLRTTLAHEVGHVACHAQLYLRDASAPSLFEERPPSNRGDQVLCRQQGIEGSGYSGEWWEYQANRCMAALLMPRRLVVKYTNQCLSRHQLDSFEHGIRSDKSKEVLEELTRIFDVSQQAMFYRLQHLAIVPQGEQRSLGLDV